MTLKKGKTEGKLSKKYGEGNESSVKSLDKVELQKTVLGERKKPATMLQAFIIILRSLRSQVQ